MKIKTLFKLAGTALRHPIWTLKHVFKGDMKKLNTYMKSEGADRLLERVWDQGYDFPIEVFNMNEREEYPVLEFPSFDKPLVSIVIPCYNQFPYTYGCLESILKNTQDVKYEIIIADDCSTDKTKELDKYSKNLVISRNENNLRFLLNCNNAAKKARGEYIFFLNNDTNVQKGWLSSLLETINSDKNIGMCHHLFLQAMP